VRFLIFGNAFDTGRADIWQLRVIRLIFRERQYTLRVDTEGFYAFDTQQLGYEVTLITIDREVEHDLPISHRHVHSRVDSITDMIAGQDTASETVPAAANATDEHRGSSAGTTRSQIS
jgi:hypothetical protein